MCSYNSYLYEPLKGVKVYANLKAQKPDGSFQRLYYAEAAKFDMEGVSDSLTAFKSQTLPSSASSIPNQPGLTWKERLTV